MRTPFGIPDVSPVLPGVSPVLLCVSLVLLYTPLKPVKGTWREKK